MGYTKTKKLLCHSLVLSMTVSMMAVAPDSSAAKKKAKPAKKTITIEQGKTKKIVIKNKKKGAKYKFAASNKKIKVYASGKVKALKVGSAKVTVKEKYKKKTKKIGTVKIVVKKKTAVVTKAPDKPTVTQTKAPDKVQEPTKAPIKTPEPVASEVYSNYFEDGNLRGFTAIGGKLEISNAENYTEGGMNSLLVTGRTKETDGAALPVSDYVITGEN